jgi:hypothetical protein
MIQKLTASAKATRGQTGRGGSLAVKRVGAGRHGGSNFNGGRQRNYDNDFRSLDTFPYGRTGNGPCGRYGGSGNARDIG